MNDSRPAVTLAMVCSIDGRSSHGTLPPSQWASAEDQAWFRQLLSEHAAVVMGRRTWEASRGVIAQSVQKASGPLRIVCTSRPELLQESAVAGRLEFSSQDPADLLAVLLERGFEKVLLAGGASLNRAFLGAGLVDAIFLTIEPVILLDGLPFAEANKGAGMQNWRLQGLRQLNEQGTLLLHYLSAR